MIRIPETEDISTAEHYIANQNLSSKIHPENA
jgi:hypothetical protein